MKLLAFSALLPLALLLHTPAGAQAPAPVVVSGSVPDEATRAAILARTRELFGAERVVDQLSVVAGVATMPQWTQQIHKLLTPELKRVSQGQLRVEGPLVEINGQVDSDEQRSAIVKGMATRLDNAAYTVRDGLRVGTGAQQALDQALANRIVEFEPGSAQLTAAGQQLLDTLLPVLQQFGTRRIEVVGHTDSDGSRERNLVLSQARADAVRDYLVARGIAAARIQTAGAGPDRPVADNRSAAGRTRNRRIEFRVLA
jgi:OOP family OmpA-OmpF porin